MLLPTTATARPGAFWHVTDPIANPYTRHDARSRMATCPEGDAEIEVDEFDVDKGDQLSCPECGSNLEVTAVSPPELDIAPEDDDEDDDVVEDDVLKDDEEAVADEEGEDDEDDEGWEE